MKDTDKNTLALDTNKWLNFLTIVEQPEKVARWKAYLAEHKFEVIMPALILKELYCHITEKDDPLTFLKALKMGGTIGWTFIKPKYDAEYYKIKADQLIKNHKIKKILEEKGLCDTDDTGRKWYALHREDLAILISLKELGKEYYFITTDGKLKEALLVKEIRDILLSEGIEFVLLYEAPNKPLTRVKILSEY
ncbi:MAG: hypothetical protein PHO02_06075 [Candidatus Nanoarchaeia archaeon]|nr:hypothetical protein [Candidatus Nanoarchaeia archaeon]